MAPRGRFPSSKSFRSAAIADASPAHHIAVRGFADEERAQLLALLARVRGNLVADLEKERD